MTNEFDQIPDFPGSPVEESGGNAAGFLPQVHPQETSEQTADVSSYRVFATSGCVRQVVRAREVYATMIDDKAKKRLASFDACRSVAWFVRNAKTGKIKVASSRCGIRWCPLCIRTRRFIITSAVASWLKTRKQPKFMTLTLKHTTAPLTIQIDTLYKCFKEFKRQPWFKKKLIGGIWFFQVKKSDTDGLWHPHLHILFEGRYLPHEEASAIWKKITRGSSVVDIRAVKNPQATAKYVARYAAAPCELCDLDFERSCDVVNALHGRRIVGIFGTGHDIKLSPKAPEDVADWQYLGTFNRILKGSFENSIDSEIVKCWRSGEFCSVEPDKPPPEQEIVEQISKYQPEAFRQTLLF